MFPKVVVLKIGDHMQYETDGNNARFAPKHDGSDDINGHCIIRVKRMKTDTAAVCIKIRRSQEVIQIHHHGSQHQQIGLFPLRPVKSQRHENRENEMEKIVRKIAHIINIRHADSIHAVEGLA